jgi:hypothetical protein
MQELIEEAWECVMRAVGAGGCALRTVGVSGPGHQPVFFCCCSSFGVQRQGYAGTASYVFAPRPIKKGQVGC